MKIFFFYVFLASFFWSCKTSGKYQGEFITPAQSAKKPARAPYDGFVWEKVSGAGIEFWAQRSKEISVGISETLPGAFIQKKVDGNELPVSLGLVIQVFPLKNQKIEDVFEVIRDLENWNPSDNCVFQSIESNRKGVTRYELRPSGKALELYNRQAKEEPVPSTCAIWGSGNSGIRYFEIHDTNKKVALFIEVGQEAPLFDEQTIVVK